MDRRVVASVVILAALAAAVTMIVKNHEARERSVSVESPGTAASESRARPLVSPLVPEQQRSLAATEETPEAALLAQVERKYRFLIADVEAEHVDELRRRLLERESQVDIGSRQRIDAGIGKLLPAQSFAYYEALKDSDLEQHHLAEYTGGIGNVAPSLTQEQYTQLKHYETTELDRELSRLQQRINAK